VTRMLSTDKEAYGTAFEGGDVAITPQDEGAYAVVFLSSADVEGYGAYARGDVATFERGVADRLRERRVARRYRPGMEMPRPKPATTMIGNYETRTVR